MWFCTLFTGLIFFIGLTPISNIMASGLIVDPMLKKSDVIAVLGGGVYMNGVLSSATGERLIHALMLYKKGYGEKLFFTGATIKELDKKIISSAGGSDSKDNVYALEGQSMFTIVYSIGIPASSIAYDDKATHTYANMTELKSYMATNKLKSCMIVTSPTHMYRSLLSAKKAGLDCSPAPVADYTDEISGIMGRLNLFHAVLWEYAGLVFYKLYGYI